LKSVDYVVLFDADTPEELIKLIKPDVLVKGGDYTYETIVGADYVSSIGGKVVTIPLVEGKSTTSIINKIIINNK
jgi:D-beta-D-heptose 7-phosphate kinase/D-beta-D-heptose 1-phosphate adenosyltransferase